MGCGRLWSASIFSNPLILESVRTGSMETIRCQMSTFGQLDRVDQLPKEDMHEQTAYCRLSAHISSCGAEKAVRACLEQSNCSSANQPFIEHPPLFFLFFQLIRHGVRRAFGIGGPCPYGCAGKADCALMQCRWRWPPTARGCREGVKGRSHQWT